MILGDGLGHDDRSVTGIVSVSLFHDLLHNYWYSLISLSSKILKEPFGKVSWDFKYVMSLIGGHVIYECDAREKSPYGD